MKKAIRIFALALFIAVLFSLTSCSSSDACLEFKLMEDGTYEVGLKSNYKYQFTDVKENESMHSIDHPIDTKNGSKMEHVPENIVIPAEYKGQPVTKISDFGFCNYAIDAISLPDSIKTLGKGAFYCSGAEQINIPDGIEVISDYSFYNTSLTSLEIPDSVVEIGRYAFGSNEFVSVEIPSGVEKIGDCAFVGCAFLENVVIPSSVNTIGDYIFYNYNYNALPALTNVSQIFYKASITSWDAIVKTPHAIDENITIYTYYEDANVFDYLDAEKKGCKIWDYNENNEPEILSFHITDTFNGKSFSYATTKVVVSDEYWSMLESAKNSGMLSEVLEAETLAIYNNSIDKASFQANLISNFQEKYQLKYNIVFSEGKVTAYYMNDQLTYPLEYIEVDNSEIYYTMSEKLAYFVEDDRLCEDLSNEYITVIHYFEPAGNAQ